MDLKRVNIFHDVYACNRSTTYKWYWKIRQLTCSKFYGLLQQRLWVKGEDSYNIPTNLYHPYNLLGLLKYFK